MQRLHVLDIFLWSRLGIWLAALSAPLLVDSVPDEVSQRPEVVERTSELGTAIDVWARWDAYSFVGIAEDGYGFAEGVAAFYPLYPAVVGVVGRLLGGHYVLAGVIVSLVACAVAFELLLRLARDLLGDEQQARWSVVFLAVFPMSFFLQAVYSEALFLTLCLAAFLLAERDRFSWCGVVVGLALLTRPTGIALLAGIAVLAWRSPSRLNLAWLGIAPALFALYPLLLWHQIGDPFAFAHVEEIWDRSVHQLGPIGGLVESARAAWAGVLQLTVGSDTDYYWTSVDPAGTAARNLEYGAYLVTFAGLTVVAWRRFGAAYGVFCAASLALPLATPTRAVPLLSLSRFCLVMFPAFIALAALTAGRPRLALGVACVSAILLGVATTRWGLWQFVA